ncbi:hypothetical protein BKA70DRAFT_1562696 [Coprinopsis sp. MPI-PUGE-AT-0042]|nr:hypothetical protein BKA70DRAFT_1562696 [Coprinopsis sp. MPI-PUGE-AT-0042]
MRMVNDNANLCNDDLQIISQERSNRIFDHDLINMVADPFVSPDLDNANPNKERLEIYDKPCKNLVFQCERILTRGHSEVVRKCSQNLLDFDNDEDMQRMVPSMRLALVGPKSYINVLLEVHRKNSETASQSFKGQRLGDPVQDKGALRTFDDGDGSNACREIFNRNAATGTLSAESLELITQHAEGDFEGSPSRVMILFKYLTDKDVIQTIDATNLSS